MGGADIIHHRAVLLGLVPADDGKGAELPYVTPDCERGDGDGEAV